jgi:hypothetical protein
MVCHAVWVIDASGIPLYHKAFTPLEFDPTLFSSFFSAIVHFQSELLGRQLQDIAFEAMSFNYIVDSGLVFLACVKKDSSTGSLLEGLRDIFFKFFGENMILLSSPLRSSPEAQALLRDFHKEVDKLVGHVPQEEPLPVRITSVPRLLSRDSEIRVELVGKFGPEAIEVVLISDGKHTAKEIAKKLNMNSDKVEKIVEHAEERGYIKVIHGHKNEKTT